MADTIALLWLMSDPDRMSPAARKELENELRAGRLIAVYVVSLVEMIYLIEKGRITEDSMVKFSKLTSVQRGPFDLIPFYEATASQLATIERASIPDMPDRMIAATALYLDLPLVTSDHHLRTYMGLTTIW